MLKFSHGESSADHKCIAFDLDHTLIKPKSGKIHPKSKDDWTWWTSTVPQKLKQLSSVYNILIVTNQTKSKVENIHEKIKDIVHELEIPVTVFICYDDSYRKPSTKSIYENEIKDLILYCGDAVGRKNDFANTDALFAFNLKIDIVTPEKMFLDKEDKVEIPPMLAIQPQMIDVKKPGVNHVILMCGYPGSGKSHFANEFGDKYDYTVLCLDILNSKKRLQTLYLEYLGKGGIIVDCTAVDTQSRSWFIEKAKEQNVQIDCVHCQTPINISYHLNYYRNEINIRTKCQTKFIPKIVYYTMRKKFQPPTTCEGFTTVYQYVPNVPRKVFQDYRFPFI